MFKIRFLTLYHVLVSLSILRDARRAYLEPRSLAYLNAILDTGDARLLTSSAIKPLRNTLVHYGVDISIPSAALDPRTPLYGLVEACLPGNDYYMIDAAVDRQLELCARVMSQWARE
jgi:hypothetical protein